MRISHDREADAAYVYLVDPIGRGEAVRTHVVDLPFHPNSITLDFDVNGHLLGMEVLGAHDVLRPATLAQAQDVSQLE
ncbi:DUF2283 domain-containing protein [Flexivirga sp.]|uniref:DUF2283 domain-containing protein n=1 Tax=Flexivirga sp. TaxID=1962927 RepID=UPI003F7F87B6